MADKGAGGGRWLYPSPPRHCSARFSRDRSDLKILIYKYMVL